MDREVFREAEGAEAREADAEDRFNLIAGNRWEAIVVTTMESETQRAKVAEVDYIDWELQSDPLAKGDGLVLSTVRPDHGGIGSIIYLSNSN